MSEETKPGAPIPSGQNLGSGHGGQFMCSEFEALLSDAIEGQLSGVAKERFDGHRRVCGTCGPLFTEVEAGRLWLRSLDPVEPPLHLVNNILLATTGVVSGAREGALAGTRKVPFAERAREWWDSWFAPTTAFVRQPRFVMSFGMIFFTFSLVVSAAGVRPADVAKIDLRPSAVRHAFNDTQIKFVQYYDNIRFVYEIESKVRQLKRATTPAEPGPQQKKENRSNDNTSRQPDQKQDRNYAEQPAEEVLARSKKQSSIDSLLLETSYEPRAASESLAAPSSELIDRSSTVPEYTVLEVRPAQAPVTLTRTLTTKTLTTNRRFV